MVVVWCWVCQARGTGTAGKNRCAGDSSCVVWVGGWGGVLVVVWRWVRQGGQARPVHVLLLLVLLLLLLLPLSLSLLLAAACCLGLLLPAFAVPGPGC